VEWATGSKISGHPRRLNHRQPGIRVKSGGLEVSHTNVRGVQIAAIPKRKEGKEKGVFSNWWNVKRALY